MVQYPIPGSAGKELPYQSGNIEETTYSLKAFLSKKAQKRRGDAAA